MIVGSISENIDSLALILGIIVFCSLREFLLVPVFLAMIVGLVVGLALVIGHEKCKERRNE